MVDEYSDQMYMQDTPDRRANRKSKRLKRPKGLKWGRAVDLDPFKKRHGKPVMHRRNRP